MELSTIEMDPALADEKFQEYAAAVKRRHDDEDAAIAQGYKALATGQRLIRLSETLRAGGVTLRKRRFGGSAALPKLAVGWADQKSIWAGGIEDNGSMIFFWNANMNPLATARNVRLGARTWDVSDVAGLQTLGWSESVVAMIPKVPPALRPARGLGGYLVLWEAEWRAAHPPAPRDPALLKRVGGDLYAVVAVWDLTDLERAVLAGRGDS